jgi:hypothetical protein
MIAWDVQLPDHARRGAGGAAVRRARPTDDEGRHANRPVFLAQAVALGLPVSGA